MRTFLRGNAIGLAALFVALGGTATALQRNSVGTPQLKNNAVKAKKIAPRAVRAPKVAPNAITTPKLAPRAVTAAKLAPGAIGAAGQVVTLPRRRITAPAAIGFNETVLFQRAPFTLTGRCNRGSSSSTSAAVYIQSTQTAIAQPFGSATTFTSVTPGAPQLVGPIASSSTAGTGNSRRTSAIWAITDAGRYVNLAVFVARIAEASGVACTFGVAGFAN